MPSLHETQARMIGALLHGDAARDATTLLRAVDAVAARRHLQIYRHNLHASLGAALAAVYPVIARLLGDACFRQVARGYVERHPSRSGNLQEFGARFADFLPSQPVLAGLPYLADVARLEWAAHEVYHEADNASFDPAGLDRVDAGAQQRVRLHLQAATRFVASPYPVLSIWQANQADAPEDVAPVWLDEGGVRLLVARSGFEVEFRLLGAGEARWLGALAEGRPLAPSVRAALETEPAFDFAASFARHLSLGSFRAWSLDGTDEDAA